MLAILRAVAARTQGWACRVRRAHRWFTARPT